MNKLLVFVTLSVIVVTTHAHLSMICSSTDPKRAGEIDFFFMTYHGLGEKAPGKITLSQPNVAGGAKVSGSFSERYKAHFKITTVGATKNAIIKALGDSNKLNAACKFDCYVINQKSQAMKAPSKGQWMVPQEQGATANLACEPGQAWGNMQSFSRLTIKGAKSGDWFMELSGTNAVYDPGKNQCSLSKTNPKWIGGMTVADGTPPCKGLPPVSSSVDPASIAGCKDMIGGAECTSFKCTKKTSKLSGTIKCSKGQWQVSAKCLSESKCAQEADKGIDGIKTEVSTCQATVNGLSDGAHCINQNKGTVTAAQNAADGAAKTAKDADAAVSKASTTKVNFNAIPLNQLNMKNCAALVATLKGNSNWATAKSGHASSIKAKTNADAQKTATASALVTAKAAQTKAILKCQCDARKSMNDAFDKCTVNQIGQKTRWRKAHHLQCVESEEATITNNKASGTCTIPAVPVMKKKAMAKHVTEAKCMGQKSQLEEDYEVETMAGLEDYEEADTEVDEVQTKVGMPGWHTMSDGTMMRDQDMY